MGHWSARIRIDGAYRIDRDHLSHRLPNTVAVKDTFENRISSSLQRIQANAIGGVLLRRINNAPNELWIAPPIQGNNPEAVHLGPANFLSGVPIPDQHPDPVTGLYPVGTGLGFTEMLLVPLHPSVVLTGGLRSLEEVMAHELVHCVRGLYGRLTMRRYQDPNFPDIDEFFAILVENMYVSQGGGSQMRISHHPLARIPGDFDDRQTILATTGLLGVLLAVSQYVDDANHDPSRPRPTLSQQWARKYAYEIDLFSHCEPELFNELAGFGTYFNPLRDYQRIHAPLHAA